MKRVLDFTVANINHPESFRETLLEPLAVMGIELSEIGKNSAQSAFDHFVHRFYELYDIHKYEQYPEAKKLDQLDKKIDSLWKVVAEENRPDLEVMQDLEKALLKAQDGLRSMKRHRDENPKSDTVYPPGVVMLCQHLILYWDDWMRNFKVKHKPGASVKSYFYQIDNQMTFELQKHLLEGVDVNNNPGGAFIQRAFFNYWGIEFTTAQMKNLILKAWESKPTKDELKIKPHIPLDAWMSYQKINMDQGVEEEVHGNFKLHQFDPSNEYMNSLQETIDNLRKWREEKNKK